VTKRAVWYLVAAVDGDSGLETRTYRVSRVRGLEVLADEARRPENFDLDQAWEEIVTDVAALERGVSVRARIAPDIIGTIRFVFGANVTLDPPEQAPAWRLGTIRARNEQAVAGQVAGFGNKVELIDPPPGVVDELRRLASELQQVYG
jgi:predicted DNA-binding transcriptional regulator YafY